MSQKRRLALEVCMYLEENLQNYTLHVGPRITTYKFRTVEKRTTKKANILE